MKLPLNDFHVAFKIVSFVYVPDPFPYSPPGHRQHPCYWVYIDYWFKRTFIETIFICNYLKNCIGYLTTFMVLASQYENLNITYTELLGYETYSVFVILLLL